MLELTMLGTGYAFSKKYYNNNALFNLNGYKLLVDCGITAHKSLHDLGLAWQNDIDGIYITHLHADHIGGLEEVALSGKYTYHQKMELFIADDLAAPLWENCLKGGTADPIYNHITDFFNVTLVSTFGFELGGYTIKPVRTLHIPGKVSYSIWIDDIFYSSDMQFNRELLEDIYIDAQFIFHECAMNASPVHTSIDELLSLPDEIQEKIWIMHYTDDLEEYRSNDRLGKLNVLAQHQEYRLKR